MAIQKRCPSCRTDNQLGRKKCSNCLTSLVDSRYRVKVRDSRTGKWFSQSAESLTEARKIEASIKAGVAPGSDDERQGQSACFSGINSFGQGVRQGVPPSAINRQTVSFEAYYDYARISKKSHRNDLEYWRNHVKDHDYRTPQGIIKILGRMKDKGLAPATIKLVLGFIKRLYNWHIENGLWDGTNPAAKIRLPRFDNRVSQPLTLDEASRLLHYLTKHPNRAMALVVSLALLTGRRQGEILGLRRDDVDMENRVIRCRDTKNGRTLIFPVCGRAHELLLEALELSTDEQALFSYTKDGFKTNWYRLRARMIREGVIHKAIRFHDLRHSYATLLCNSGKVDIYTLQKLLGHSCIALTQRYSHLLDRTMREATGVLDSML